MVFSSHYAQLKKAEAKITYCMILCPGNAPGGQSRTCREHGNGSRAGVGQRVATNGQQGSVTIVQIY